VATAFAAVAAGTLPGAQASGDSAVVVRGTALPSGAKSQLNLVGCDSVFARTSETVAPAITVVPGRPGNKRSLGFDLGGGNAVGSVSYVDQVAATTVAGMAVHAEAGTIGVAYVGYQAPQDVGTSLMWIGRAPLAVPASSWTSINVPGLGYAWTQYDMSTQQPIGGEVGSSGIPAFTRAMGGDGAGFYMVGFGCDGNAFNTDAWKIGTFAGATTYDFEGFTTRTTIAGPEGPIEPGKRATLTGTVVDGAGAPVGGRAVLEAKQGDGTWDTVDVAPGPSPSAVVRPEKTTTYRWKFFDRARYEGSVSGPLTVTVEDPAEQPAEQPTPDPSEQPADKPGGTPSSQAPIDTPAEQVAPPADTATQPADAPPAAPATEQAEQTPQTQQPEPADEPAPPAADPPAGEQPTAEQSAPAETAAVETAVGTSD
jgi:hypothetical protein